MVPSELVSASPDDILSFVGGSFVPLHGRLTYPDNESGYFNLVTFAIIAR